MDQNEDRERVVDIIAEAIAAGIEAWKKNDEDAMNAAIDNAVEKLS